jgi:enoyl-CoA hydratase
MAIELTVEDGVALLTLDNGRVNAFDLGLFEELNHTLDDCADYGAVVIAGRPGMFSAGLNTKVMAGLDAAGMAELITAFGETMLRVWEEPRPTVAAATGHAVAGGTILAMCCDHAVAAEGDFRWGLTETSIGMVLPSWVLTIARGNVPADRLDDLALPGRAIPPEEAVAAGYADELAPPEAVLQRALARARELAALPRAAYAGNKQRLRGAAAAAAREGLRADVVAGLAATA